MIYYHYTTKNSYEQIIKTNQIMMSDPLTTMDASYGKGWYFTDLGPNNCNAWTAAHCWRSLNVFEKVEYYLEFDIPDNLIKKCRDHVFMLNIWDQQIQYKNGGENPKCPKGPCLKCEVISKIKEFFNWK
jgi:uncharacterized protein (DUF39 family)